MKSVLVVATFLLLNIVVISAKPQFSGCGPNGCYNVNNNGQGAGCGPNGCGFIAQPIYQPTFNSHSQYATTGDGKCGPHGCTTGGGRCNQYGCTSD